MVFCPVYVYQTLGQIAVITFRLTEAEISWQESNIKSLLFSIPYQPTCLLVVAFFASDRLVIFMRYLAIALVKNIYTSAIFLYKASIMKREHEVLRS